MARVDGKGLQKVGRYVGRGTMGVEGDEAVHEEGGFRGVDVGEDFGAEGWLGREVIIEVIVFVEEIPEK